MDSSIFCCCCENSDFTIYYIQNAWSASSCCIWEYGSWTSADFIFVCIRCIPYRLRKEDEEEKGDLENRIEVVMVSSPNRTDLVFPKVWPCLFHQVFRTQNCYCCCSFANLPVWFLPFIFSVSFFSSVVRVDGKMMRLCTKLLAEKP